MDQREALRASILDEPLDDSRRLGYADWLEANGDLPRAEFIRAQVGWAKLPPFSSNLVRRSGYDARRWALEQKQRELLARYEKDWLGASAKPRWGGGA